MGLLDSLLYDSQGYGGQGGGLLDFLRSSQMQQANYQPSAGFPSAAPQGGRFDAATFDPTTYAPSQSNNPIAVGSNYQMPRIGSPDQFQPQQAMTPPNAQPTQGQSPQGQPMPQQPMQQPEQQQLPPALGGGSGGFNLGNLGRAFNPDGLIARLTGNDSRSIAQQNLKAQYDATRQALISNGVPEQQASSTAMLSVMNPEAAKTVLPELLTNKEKWSKTGVDQFGREKYGFVNERDQTVNGNATKSQGTSDETGGIPGDITKTGDAYLASLPKEFQGVVKGFVDGTARMPVITTKNQQAMQMYFDMAKQADPSFDSTNYSARQKGMQSFKSGADAGTVRSANQVLGHISDLTDMATDLGNRSFVPWNYVANSAESTFGNDAANNWVTQAHAVADEMSAFMKGAGHSSDTEIKQWKDSLSADMSPKQQRGAIRTLMGIYDHALQALEDKRTGAIGQTASEKMGPLLTQAGQAAKNKVNGWVESGKSNAVPQGKPQTVIQNGHTYTLQADGNYK